MYVARLLIATFVIVVKQLFDDEKRCAKAFFASWIRSCAVFVFQTFMDFSIACVPFGRIVIRWWYWKFVTSSVLKVFNVNFQRFSFRRRNACRTIFAVFDVFIVSEFFIVILCWRCFCLVCCVLENFSLEFHCVLFSRILRNVASSYCFISFHFCTSKLAKTLNFTFLCECRNDFIFRSIVYHFAISVIFHDFRIRYV